MRSYLKEQVDKIMAYLFKVERRTLLWTNPSPTSPFAAQTISLDLSNYDAVDVEFRHWTNKDCRVTTRNYLNEGEGVGIGISTDAASYGNYRRGFKMYTNGVQFWGGTANANIENNSTIPVRIWGVKLGGVQRSISKAFRRFTSLSKGGGVDGTVIEGFDSETSFTRHGHDVKQCAVDREYEDFQGLGKLSAKWLGRHILSIWDILCGLGRNTILRSRWLRCIFDSLDIERTSDNESASASNQCRKRINAGRDSNDWISITISERRCAA